MSAAMPRTFLPHFLLVVFLLLATGCSRPLPKEQPRASETYVSDPSSVGFDIASLSRENGSLRILATYQSQGKLAKFGIEFGPTRNLESKDSKDFPMETGEGRFVAEPGSDETVLLADL
jgi:hypothetical protein